MENRCALPRDRAFGPRRQQELGGFQIGYELRWCMGICPLLTRYRGYGTLLLAPKRCITEGHRRRRTRHSCSESLPTSCSHSGSDCAKARRKRDTWVWKAAALFDGAWPASAAGRNDAEISQADPFGWITSAELNALRFDSPDLVKGVLKRYQPAIMGGGYKGLKTSVGADLAISLGTATDFLGCYPVEAPVHVGFMSGESGDSAIQNLAKRIAKARSICLDAVKVSWSFRLPELGTKHGAGEAAIKRAIEQRKFDVLFLDPVYKTLNVGSESSNLFRVGECLGPITELARSHKVTLILQHHYQKGKGQGRTSEAPHLGWLAGAGYAEWARQWLLLSRRRPYSPETPGSHKLRMVWGGSWGHTGQSFVDVEEGIAGSENHRWDTACRPVNESEQKPKQSADTTEKRLQQLLDALRDTPEGDSRSSSYSRAKLSTGSGKAAEELGIDRGLIETCSVQKGRNVVEGIRLKAGK